MESIVSQNLSLKSMKKCAFSLAELLVVLTVIAMLVVATMTLHRAREEKAMGKLYIKAYSSLRLASFNIQEEVLEHNDAIRAEAIEAGLAIPPYGSLRKFPNIPELEKAEPANFCAAAITKLNTVKEGCSIINVVHGALPKTFELPEEPSFRTSDGMKYFVTNIGSPGFPSEEFFLVFIDLNGDRKPNTHIYDPKRKKSDIVPFLISKENGDIVPTGWPVYDKNYLQARVISAKPELTIEYSPLMTFAQAKKLAYRGKSYELDPLSSKNLDNYLGNTYPEDITVADPPYTSISSSCVTSSLPNSVIYYSTTTDFPPCKVEINTNMK